MCKRLLPILLALSLLLTTAAPLLAQDDQSEPFCGDLSSADCDLLRTAANQLLSNAVQQAANTYTITIHGISEMPVSHIETALQIEGDYSYDIRALRARRLLLARNEAGVLALSEAIAANPDLLLELLQGTEADLAVVLTFNGTLTTWLGSELDTANGADWPERITMETRLHNGFLYLDLRELKALVPRLATAPDEVQFALADEWATAVERGVPETVTAAVSAGVNGEPITGLDPTVGALLTALYQAFGQPALLDEYTTIRRGDDVTLSTSGLRKNPQTTTVAYYETDFAVTDFVFSDEFRALFDELFLYISKSEEFEGDPTQMAQFTQVFWILAPVIFLDLEVGGSTTVDLATGFPIATTGRFDWNLSSLVKALRPFGVDSIADDPDDVYIAFTNERTHAILEEPIAVTIPETAVSLPLTALTTAPVASREVVHEDVEIAVEPSAATIAYVDEGLAALEQEAWQDAIIAFDAAIARYPDYAEAYYRRGQAHKALEQLTLAQADFEQATLHDPTLAEAHYELGILAGAAGEWEDAIADYSAAIEHMAESPVSYFERGYAHKQIGDYSAAIDDFTAVIELESDNYAAYAHRADTQLILGSYEMALVDATTAIELEPTFDWAYAIRGSAYYRQGAYEAAIEEFTAAIERNADYAWAYIQRANAHVSLNHFAAGIADATAAITIDPNYDWAYATRGNAYRQQGNDEAALADFDKVIELTPNYDYAYYSRGLIYQNRDDYEAALAEYNRALSITPNYVEALMSRGFVLTQLGDNRAAIADYDTVITLSPEYPGVYNDRGVAYENLDAFDEALTDYSTALELDPDYLLARENRASLYRRRGEMEQALSDLNYLIGLDTTDADYYYNRGRVLEALDGIDAALANYTEAILIDPDDALYYRARGSLYHDYEKYEAAVADYSEAIALDPNYAFAYNSRGIALADLERYEEAIVDYDQAIALVPNYDSAFNNRAIAYEELGDYAQAIADYSQAIAITPTDALYYRNRASLYRQLDQYAEAIADYSQALELEPDHLNALYYRGDSWRRLENFDAALDDFDAVLAIDTNDVDAHFGIGQVLFSKGDLVEAIRYYVIATKLDPEWASPFNSLCWTHGLLNQPEIAMPYCETALDLEPDDPYILDSRGLNHALLGNNTAAIADFQAYIDAFVDDETQAADVEKRRDWIAALEADETPITPEVLEALQNE